jgi:HEAT repeat protein
MKNDPIQTAIARLDDFDPQTPDGKKHFVKALAAKSNLIAAKAARIAGDAQCTSLTADLAAAFDRFLTGGAALDKGCAATIAIARALVAFDFDDADLFRRGMKHVQMEGTWGGSEDMAAELRAVCAMGLANTPDRHKLRDLVELLVDPKWPARAGAVRAIAAIGSDSATLLLRFKALLGDSEPEVVSDCLGGLLETEGAEALPLAKALAESRRQETREAAILALGASRRSDAIGWLGQRFGQIADHDTKKCILLAMASSRTEPAIEFLLDLIRKGPDATAAMAISTMSIYNSDPVLRELIGKATASRGQA